MKSQILVALLVAAAAPNGSAWAMSQNSQSQLHCVVEGAEKLPAEIGGEQAVCAAIAAAVLPALKQAGISPDAVGVSVQVKSNSRLSAVPSVNGKALAEQNAATSDRPLTARTIGMLADAVAGEISTSGLSAGEPLK